ncbi:MAG: TetR family transcriptional regulator [Desulfobulbaceae bacterium A2]|nr:MAG: TetR family transcriptional regulator [Desulfobulbaceae bacterium A2]
MDAKKTRERLIDAAYEELYSKGYQGAALADILRVAGVHKGSLYHFFAGKKDLAITAISERMAQRFAARYGTIAARGNDYVAALIDVLRDTSLRDFRRGCPLANLVQEMSNLDEDFDRALKAIYADYRATIRDILERAVAAGELRPCDTARLATFITVVTEGAILAAKASGEIEDYSGSIEELARSLAALKPT